MLQLLAATGRALVSNPHSMIVKPIYDRPRLQVELSGQRLHLIHSRIRVVLERPHQLVLLLLAEDEPPLWLLMIALHFRIAPLQQVLLLLPLIQLLQPRQVVQPHVHSQIRLTAFNTQRIPRLRLRQQLAHCALRQVQHRLAEQLLTDVVVQ